MSFKHKKSLGQHFLKDDHIAGMIVNGLESIAGFDCVMEIGPGQGVLTHRLADRYAEMLYVVEIDRRLVPELKKRYPTIKDRIIEADFLKMELKETECNQIAIIGNFPYNISSQIIFRMLSEKASIPLLVGMFQKEVAKRLVSKGGSKDYGILSVLVNTYYNSEYLFDVDADRFIPPPRVDSGVIRLIRKEEQNIGCDEKFFKTVVKAAFHKRRKTLHNSLKGVVPEDKEVPGEYRQLRPEQLTVHDFIKLTKALQS